MAYLGDLNITTGVDTTFRPGESVYDYMARIGREQAEYSRFIEAQRAGAGVSTPLLPAAATTPTSPAAKKSGNALKVIVIGGGLLALAFVLLKKP